MHKWAVKYALILALALAAPAALALRTASDALLRAVAFEVIDTIKQDQGVQASDPVKIAALVETRVVPLFDFVHMTRLATARNWRLATPEQQRRLGIQFRPILVRGKVPAPVRDPAEHAARRRAIETGMPMGKRYA